MAERAVLVEGTEEDCPFNGLPSQVVIKIFELLTARECAVVACVQRSWRHLAREDGLWQAHCRRDWLAMSLDDVPPDYICPNYMSMYMAHMHEYGRYGALFPRAKRCWAAIRAWTQEHAPAVARSLNAGVSEEELDAAEHALHVTLPPAMRVLYRLCNGQTLDCQYLRDPPPPGAAHFAAHEEEEEFEEGTLEREVAGLSRGLLGGYFFYSHLATTQLLPLASIRAAAGHSPAAAAATRRRPGGRGPPPGRRVPVAVSTLKQKTFVLDCASGRIFACTKSPGFMLPCVPPLPAPQQLQQNNPLAAGAGAEGGPGGGVGEGAGGGAGTNRARGGGEEAVEGGGAAGGGGGEGGGEGGGLEATDGMLRWLEAYAARLQDGTYIVRRLHADMAGSRGISLFPETPPACATAVTNGVQIRISAVFVPELSTIKYQDPERYYFSYSVRMRLLPGGAMASCQLTSRHWVIRDGDAPPEDVQGLGVIGKYPILRAGEDEFVYQSCSGLVNDSGSIQGAFTFVPGSVMRPSGVPFEAQVARCKFEVPNLFY